MEDINIYKKQGRLSFWGFIIEIPSFVVLAVSALLTGSTLVWVDLLDSVCYLLQTGFVTAISRKLRNNLKYKYNYGYERLEVFASLFCDAMLCLGAIGVVIGAVYGIINPQKPSDFLLIVVVLKIIEILIDGGLAAGQINLYRRAKTPVLKTAVYGTLKDIAFDGLSFALIGASYFFRENILTWYLGPVASLVIAMAFIISRASDIRINIRDSTDRTLDEDVQLEILKCMADCNDMYDQFKSIHSHRLAGKLYVDIDVSFAPEQSYEKICAFKGAITQKIGEKHGKCEVTVRV